MVFNLWFLVVVKFKIHLKLIDYWERGIDRFRKRNRMENRFQILFILPQKK